MHTHTHAHTDTYYFCVPPPVWHLARLCPWGQLFLFPATAAALVSCRVWEPAGGWCAPSRASGSAWPYCRSSGCWWTAYRSCCLTQTGEPASCGTWHIYLNTQKSRKEERFRNSKWYSVIQCNSYVVFVLHCPHCDKKDSLSTYKLYKIFVAMHFTTKTLSLPSNMSQWVMNNPDIFRELKSLELICSTGRRQKFVIIALKNKKEFHIFMQELKLKQRSDKS